MILNSEDIYNNIESYRNSRNYSQDKMAELIGMSGKSAYSAMIKNRRLKLEYLINLINNSDANVDQLFRASTKDEQSELKNEQAISNSESSGNSDCPCCKSKQNEINALQIALAALNELLDNYRKQEKRETDASISQKAG